MVPTVSLIVLEIAPPVSESKLELNAHAQALVPAMENQIKYLLVEMANNDEGVTFH